MNKAEREDFERTFAQQERSIEATLKLAAAMERVADAQEQLTAQAVVQINPKVA